MDIFEYAKNYNADYYDPNTGYIYHVQEYNRTKKFGLPTNGIRVSDMEGNDIGVVPEKAS